jgi:hypothetical protein
MKDKKRLLVSPPPYIDESFEGYIARLTTVNCYESIRWIYEDAKLISSKNNVPIICHSFQDFNLQILSDITGASEKMLWDLTHYTQFGNLKKLGLINYVDKFLYSVGIFKWKSKVCPKCLKENNYIRKLWSLSIYNVCHVHSCELIKDCPNCGEEINISNIPIGSCKCGYNLQSTEVFKFPDINRNVENFLYLKLYNPEGLSKYTNNYLVNLDFKIVVFLILYFARKIDNPKKTQKHLKSSQTSFNIFYDWKENFFSFLDNYRKRSKVGNFTGLQKDFGSLVNEILDKFNKASPDGHLDFIVNAFKEYLTEKWDGGYLPEVYINKFDLERKWLSKGDVVDLLRIAPFSIDKLIEAGVLSARVLKTDERKMVLIHRDEVKNYIKESKKVFTVQETREKLGIREDCIFKLLNTGLLKGENRIKNKKTWSIDAESVNKIVEAFESKVRKDDIFGFEKLITFQKCLRISTGEHKDIVDFIKEVFSGKITHIFSKGNENGLNKYYFLENEVKKVMGEENIYSLSQIAREFAFEKILVSFWVKNGFLQAEVTDKKMRITNEDLHEFMSTYITMKEICRRTNDRPGTVLANLKGYTFKAISGAKVDGSRMYLFLRKDIEPILKKWSK